MFLAMTISKPSQLSLDNMMSSQEVSPAKTLVSQVEEKELQTNPDQVYFTNSSESYAWYDQSSLSWKTWQRSLITDWTLFSESFPKQGTMQNGQLYLQVHWEQPTDVQGGGALPTPTTMDHLPPRSMRSMMKQTQVHRKGRTKLANLREAVNPQTVELFNHLQMLPTPTATNARQGVNSYNNKGKPLLRAALLPTPTARDYKGRSSVKWNQEYGQRNIPDVLTQTGDHMSVSPYFLEEVMGYPIGWTALEH